MKNVDPNRCAGKTKAGKPCRAAATAGGLCFFHANPNKASELGRIGGSKRRPAGTEPSDEFPAAATAAELRDLGTRLIADILAGRINPRTAAGLVPLMNLQLRAVEVAGLETRLNKLEHDFAREQERRNT